MSHVDEGQIHAYLDGQLEYAAGAEREQFESHVAECPDCAALLEEARAIHTRAAGVLGDSEPVRVPAFEEVLHRASQHRTRSASVRKLHRTRTLAWAASIVVAVAVGWYARVSTTSSPQDPGAQAEVGEPVAALSVDDVSETAPEAEAAPPPAAPAADRDAFASEATANRAEAVGGAGVEANEEAADRRLVGGRAAAPAVSEQRRVRADSLAMMAELRQAADSARRQVVARESQTRGFREAEAQQGAVSQVTAMADAVESFELSPEDAERLWGRRLFLVEGLDVVRITASGAMPDGVVRVVQRLPSGDSLEILQRPAELDQVAGAVAAKRLDAPAEEKTAETEEGISSVVTTRGDLRIELRGRVSSDSLGVLLLRLREAPRAN